MFSFHPNSAEQLRYYFQRYFMNKISSGLPGCDVGPSAPSVCFIALMVAGFVLSEADVLSVFATLGGWSAAGNVSRFAAFPEASGVFVAGAVLAIGFSGLALIFPSARRRPSHR